MGTETGFFVILFCCFSHFRVKLNNPLMGTETIKNKGFNNLEGNV